MASLQQAFVTKIRIGHVIGAGEWHPHKTIQQSNFYVAYLRGSKFCYVEAAGPTLAQGTELDMADFDASTGQLSQLIFRQKNLGTALQVSITPLSVPSPGAGASASSPFQSASTGQPAGEDGADQTPAYTPRRRSIMDITRDMCR